MLFVFFIVIVWFYYGDRVMIYLFGLCFVMFYWVIYVVGFVWVVVFDIILVWVLLVVVIVIMILLNLFGIVLLSKEMKEIMNDYWFRIKK